MTDIWTRLKNEDKTVLIYGTGNGADKILDELQRCNINVSGFFASSGFVRNRYFRGFKVMSIEEAEAAFGDFTILFAFGSNRPEVIANIKVLSQRHTVLAPEVPVCGGEVFNIEYAQRHAEALHTAYSLLYDEQSRTVFEQTTLFKLDGDISRLFICETAEDEAFADILHLKNGSSFLDLGAYNGDTVLDFTKRVKDYGKIVAVEPDKKSFAKLLKNTDGIGITAINAAISEHDGAIPFSFKSSRGSHSGGEDLIQSVCIDSLARDVSFDYIKFDVEGNEADAIKGGKLTIKNRKPKMLVSAYHKSDDYFTIPLLVHEINPDYKIFMRHYSYVPAWDTNYYFV